MNGIQAGQQPESANRRDRSRFSGRVAAQLTVLLLVGLGIALMIRGASAADANRAVTVPTAVTVSLASLPSEMSSMYQYAADHADHFATIPCYCGCDNSLGHRSLEDCFVTAEGGWDAHASGCGVCSAEATTAKELLDDDGVAAADVRQQVIDRYGPPPASQQGAQP
ncbi:MAG: PCYCGC motif-containing (lipo)protein [Ilumatobacteraceae bacterium]